MEEPKKHGGCPPKYLTIERFEKFINNDFRHLNWKVNFMFIILLATFGTALARLFIG